MFFFNEKRYRNSFSQTVGTTFIQGRVCETVYSFVFFSDVVCLYVYSAALRGTNVPWTQDKECRTYRVVWCQRVYSNPRCLPGKLWSSWAEGATKNPPGNKVSFVWTYVCARFQHNARCTAADVLARIVKKDQKFYAPTQQFGQSYKFPWGKKLFQTHHDAGIITKWKLSSSPRSERRFSGNSTRED